MWTIDSNDIVSETLLKPSITQAIIDFVKFYTLIITEVTQKLKQIPIETSETIRQKFSQSKKYSFVPDDSLIEKMQTIIAAQKEQKSRKIDVSTIRWFDIETGYIWPETTIESIVQKVNETFGIQASWEEIFHISQHLLKIPFTSDSSKLIGKKLEVCKNFTVDITTELDRFMQECVEFLESKCQNKASAFQLTTKMFREWWPCDLKRYDSTTCPMFWWNKKTKGRHFMTYIYNGRLIRYDAIGNIAFWYVMAYLWVDLEIAKKWWAYVQMMEDVQWDVRRLKNPLPRLRLEDNAGDDSYIDQGYRLFQEKIHNNPNLPTSHAEFPHENRQPSVLR